MNKTGQIRFIPKDAVGEIVFQGILEGLSSSTKKLSRKSINEVKKILIAFNIGGLVPIQKVSEIKLIGIGLNEKMEKGLIVTYLAATSSTFDPNKAYDKFKEDKNS